MRGKVKIDHAWVLVVLFDGEEKKGNLKRWLV
jgi:hypothetical protein